MLYLIKLNIILALLCLLFQVVMHRDTFFSVRRAMLWGIYLTAFLLPLWNVQSWLQGDAAAMHVASDYATYVLPSLEVTATRVAAMGIQQEEPGCGMWFVGMLAIWAIIYLIPVVWMTLKLLWQFAYIIYLRCTCLPSLARPAGTLDPSRTGEGLEEGIFYSFPRPCSPFSFGPWIFLHAEGMDRQTLREVLIHEQAHVRGWHTLDILFSQFVCILFWWNPAVWVLRREVRLNLEFIADKAVADSLSPLPNRGGDGGGALKAYQYRLLGFATQTNVATIANNFNVLPLKRRIVMMNLKRTRRTGMVKYAVFVPIAAALLFLSNIDALARTFETKVHKVDVAGDHQPLMVVNDNVIEDNGDDSIYDIVEHLPKYPGGEEELFGWIARNVCYPAAAHDWGVQGRVIVAFVVEKDGTITDVNAPKLVDAKSGQELREVFVTANTNGQTPEEIEAAKHQAEGIKALKAEAERVVKALPKRWEPGKHGGKPVRYRFHMPITFRLQ